MMALKKSILVRLTRIQRLQLPALRIIGVEMLTVEHQDVIDELEDAPTLDAETAIRRACEHARSQIVRNADSASD
jgi:hypothetical protein